MALYDDGSGKTRLCTVRLATGDRELLVPLEREYKGNTLTVPAGFVTDYSSVPAFARFIVRWSKIDVAGVVHDWCYAVGLPDASGVPSRKLSDEIWLHIAQSGHSSANWLQAHLCWLGLRIGGKPAWRKHRARDAPEA